MLDIPCVIFAGGRSSRMGEDKALLPFSTSKTLTEYQLHRLQNIFSHVYVSCKTKEKFDFEANFIEDIELNSLFAPSIGFISVFKRLQCERFFAISVDTPFIDLKIIQTIISRDSLHVEATIAQTVQGAQPLCGIYHISILPKLEEMLHTQNHKMNSLLRHSQTEYINFDNEQAFFNINHPYEYKKAKEVLVNNDLL